MKEICEKVQLLGKNNNCASGAPRARPSACAATGERPSGLQVRVAWRCGIWYHYHQMMRRLCFESMGRKALVRRGRSRMGAFAHGSNTPPPHLLAKAVEGRLTASDAMSTRIARGQVLSWKKQASSPRLPSSVFSVLIESSREGARHSKPAALNAEVQEERSGVRKTWGQAPKTWGQAPEIVGTGPGNRGDRNRGDRPRKSWGQAPEKRTESEGNERNAA